MRRNIALRLQYDGTAYHGWQVQKTDVTVAETLERALTKVCGEPIKVVGCGRTDAGVHAERYIANFHTESRIPVERLPFAINTHTPEDIVVREALEVAEDFNAIGSCLKKEYTYRIYNSRVKNPFYVNRAYFYPKRLDEEFLNRAAHQFVGTHDFAAVRSVGTETKTTVRTIYWCDVTRSGELLELKVCADGSSITWCGPSPARCSTPPKGSSCRRIFRPFWKAGTGRWRDPRCRRGDCT